MEDIKDEDFTEEKIENDCTGPNFLKFVVFLQYTGMKLQNNFEEYIHELFIEECYKVADNLDFVQSCDLLEKDILNMIWWGFNIYIPIRNNDIKYLHVSAKMPKETFNFIMSEIKYNFEPYWEKLIYLHEYHDKSLVLLKVYLEEKKLK